MASSRSAFFCARGHLFLVCDSWSEPEHGGRKCPCGMPAKARVSFFSEVNDCRPPQDRRLRKIGSERVSETLLPRYDTAGLNPADMIA